jgi:hypothetical protein
MVIPKLRQHRALTQAIVSCETVIAGLKQDISAEFVTSEQMEQIVLANEERKSFIDLKSAR